MPCILRFGGGSGGGGGQTNTNKFEPPLWTLNQWPDLVQAYTTLATQPQQNFYGQRIAGINNTQAQGMQYLANLSGNTSPDMAAARRNAQLTASGAYENPYASVQTLVPDNPYLNTGATIRDNEFVGQTTNVLTNPYQGMSEQYRAVKQGALDDVVQAYRTGTAAQTDAANNRAGAFKGGGHLAQISANENNLARNLGRTSSEMDFGQWDRSGGLAQQYIQNRLNAQQGDLNRNVGAEQNWLQYAMQAEQEALQRNSAYAQQGINLGVNAQQTDLARASGAWDSERNRQMGAFDQALAGNQFDQNNARNMIGIGDIQRGYTQDLLNQQYGDWQQHVNYPLSMLQMYGSGLSQASGNYGQNTQMQSGPMYQANPFAQAVGLGLTGAGLYSGWGG